MNTDFFKVLLNYGIPSFIVVTGTIWFFVYGTKMLEKIAHHWIDMRRKEYDKLSAKDSMIGNEVTEISKQVIVNKRDIETLNLALIKLERNVNWQQGKIINILTGLGFRKRNSDNPSTSPPTLPKLPRLKD